MAKQGSLSINSENIFPIIKKWLYSDHDIFIRELVSNGCDAVTKLKKLSVMGEFEEADDEKYKVEVRINPTDKTLTFIDNGIGMTEDEVDEYINQIAFSGAAAFMEQYKDKASDEQIIGHFGLGFYSAFMVAYSVEIDSLSYQDGAKAAKWTCDGSMEFDLTDGDRTERGTTITLNIAEDSEEFLEESTIRQILHKYCAFLPIEIYVEVPEDKHEDHCDCGHDHEHEHEHEDDTPSEPKPINNTTPLWMKKPSECTDEEYKEFYRNVFMDFNEPLFWIHLNVDYPFNLKGILYFPKINHEFAGQEGQIKLYNNQVFVADNVKEVIPEFLMLLKGVIDCPDLPLNVSRSFLQNDGYVKKISSHITKKVADKLASIYNNERENYEKYWDYINIFIKYGCLRDEKFYEKVKDVIIYKDIDGKGAKYSVKIIIPSNDNSHGDIKLEQIFYVKEECVPYVYNPLYYNETYKSLADGKTYNDCIVIKGQNTSGHWEMSSVVSEHFANMEGENIFEYYNKVNNVNALQFQWASGITGVTPDPLTSFNTDETVKLTEAMTKRDDVKNMTYKVTLVNDETCNFNYNIVFVNPFVAGTTNGISIYGNGIGENTGATMPQVVVKDNEGSNIYSYNNTSKTLVLSSKATDTYKLTNDIVSVEYAFVENAAWTELTSNMSKDSKLEVNDVTGVVTWKNQGSTLVKDYNLTVTAKVTFKDLSVVTCNIPVKLAKDAQ